MRVLVKRRYSMSNIVHSNKNNNRDNFSVRGLQRAVDNIFDSFFTG